jgi:hypothetical protein
MLQVERIAVSRLRIQRFRIHFMQICKGKVKQSLCLTNSALRHGGVCGSGCINPHFLDLGTSWK